MPQLRDDTSPAPQTTSQRIFYLAMDDLYESQIAKAWAKQHGKSGLVFSIPLERLTLEMVIVPIVRVAETRTPMIHEEWSAGEQKLKTQRRKPEELMGELVECKPIRVKEFWRSSSGSARAQDAFSELLMGKLDQSAFIDAVNESTGENSVFPRTHGGDDNKTMKLTWGS